MVGVSRKDIAALARWFGGLSLPMRALIVAGLAVAALGLTWVVINAQQEARLVRSDPELPAWQAGPDALRGRPGPRPVREPLH